ncbi:MAG: hypothetical protein ACREQI_13510 [Candidatus Binataceae bacterium]
MIVLIMPMARPAYAAEGSAPFGYGVFGAIEDYFANWYVRSDAAKASQPHWMTPLVTIAPLLQQEVRYDQFWDRTSSSMFSPCGGLPCGCVVGKKLHCPEVPEPYTLTTDNFGGGKGLELIPEEHTEIIVGMPAFLKRSSPRNTDGFGDLSYLVKLRLLSGNEQHGNYIVTAFMGFTVPTGSKVNGAGHATFTPTIAAGKGFGDFDVQSTLGVTFPSGGLDRLGMPLGWNTIFQYHAWRYFWPEIETNYTWFSYGEKTGHNQLFLTPGILIGRIPINDRLGIVIGTGDMIAVTRYRTMNSRWIVTARLLF